MTVNQVLVACLILVLVGFIVVLAIMAKHAIELFKKTMVLVDDGKETLDSTKELVDTAGDKVITAATSVAADTTPAIKALVGAAGGFTALNTARLAGRILTGNTFVTTAKMKKDRKRAEKELRETRKLTAKLNEQALAEARLMKQANKIAARTAKKDRKAAKKLSNKEAKRAAKIAKKDRKAAKKAARKAK